MLADPFHTAEANSATLGPPASHANLGYPRPTPFTLQPKNCCNVRATGHKSELSVY